MAWRRLDAACFDKILAMILAIVTSFRHFLGWAVSALRFRGDLILENLALRRQLLALHAKQPRRRMTTLHKLFWVVLRRFVVRMGAASHPGDAQNRGRMASGRIPVVLDMGFKSQTSGRTKAGEQGSPCSNLSHGRRESDLGSAADPRRTPQAGFQAVRNNSLAMGSKSPERSRSRRTLAHFPQESS